MDGNVAILQSRASGKTLRSFHGTAQGVGGFGAHGIALCIYSTCISLFHSPTIIQLSGKFMYAGLESLLYKTCTHLNTGLQYTMEKLLERYALIPSFFVYAYHLILLSV